MSQGYLGDEHPFQVERMAVAMMLKHSGHSTFGSMAGAKEQGERGGRGDPGKGSIMWTTELTH